MNRRPSTKGKTVSFRLDGNVLDKLKTHAKSEGLTLNLAANQLLAQSVNWNIRAAKSGWVPIPKSNLVVILDRLSNKNIVEIARKAGREVLKEMSLSMGGKVAIRDFLAILGERAKAAGFSYTEIENNDELKFITKHDMGIKWSMFWKTLYTFAFKELGCTLKFELTENTLVYKLDKKFLN